MIKTLILFREPKLERYYVVNWIEEIDLHYVQEVDVPTWTVDVTGFSLIALWLRQKQNNYRKRNTLLNSTILTEVVNRGGSHGGGSSSYYHTKDTGMRCVRGVVIWKI